MPRRERHLDVSPMGDWKDAAACRDRDPRIFFPEEGDRAGEELALSICAECPVTDVCLEYAAENRIEDGIWGGKLEWERARRRRRPRPATELRVYDPARCPSCQKKAWVVTERRSFRCLGCRITWPRAGG